MRRNTLFECTDVLKINSKKKFKKILKKPLTKTQKCGILIFVSFDAGYAGIAQLAEQLICNQQVVGSSPITSSTSEQAIYRLLWFFLQKIRAHSCRCSSFIAKGHICVGYSVASAFITPLAHYQPFAKRRLRRKYLYGSPLPQRCKKLLAPFCFIE